MPRPLPALLYEARSVLNTGGQAALGVLLGSSRRSGERWARGEARPSERQLVDLARRVAPLNVQLAAELAEHARTTLAAIGVLVVPPRPRPATEYILDSVVCAAADAMGVAPDAVRPAVRAAFQRARAVGVTLEEVEEGLGGREEKAKKVAARTGAA